MTFWLDDVIFDYTTQVDLIQMDDYPLTAVSYFLVNILSAILKPILYFCSVIL